MIFLKPIRRAKQRKPLRRIGAATRRYLEARDVFLWGLWVEVAEKGTKEASVPCAMACGRGVRVWREGERMCTNGDVDHILTRSRRPDLRCDPANLQVLCRTCHRAKHAR